MVFARQIHHEAPTAGARDNLRVLIPSRQYAQMPYDVLFDRSLSHGARLLFAILQSHWRTNGACYASHQTLAAEMAVGDKPLSLRQLRRYLDALIAHGYVLEESYGRRQGKAYRPASGQPQQDTGDRLEAQGNKTPVSDYTPEVVSNKTPVTHYNPLQQDTGDSLEPFQEVQQDTGVQGNKTPVSDSYEVKPGSKDLRKKELLVTPETVTSPDRKVTVEQTASVPAPEAPHAARPKNKSAQVIDLLRERGLSDSLSSRDHKAIKETSADPSTIVEAFNAAFVGTWPVFWIDSLCVRMVIEHLPGYLAAKRGGGRRSRDDKSADFRYSPVAVAKQSGGHQATAYTEEELRAFE